MAKKTQNSNSPSGTRSQNRVRLGQNLKSMPGGKLNNFLNNFSEKIIDYKKSKTIYIILIIAGVLLLAIYKKSWFIAATVNGSPITNLELQMRLNQLFRAQVLDQLINEKIVLGEITKNNALATDTEVNKRISEIETDYGGADTFNAILSGQGATRESIRQPIRLRLSIDKLYAKEATVSAEEITKFIEQNKEQLQATDSAGQQKESYDAIKNQKIRQISDQKFQELRQKAKIQIF